MKYSTKLSDTVHVMVLIAINQEKSLSSASIAESVHTNPGFVRQLMLKLKKAGLMTSVAGHARPSLSKPADQITLLDIYKAVEGEKPLLHLDTHTNPVPSRGILFIHRLYRIRKITSGMCPAVCIGHIRQFFIYQMILL